MIHILKKYILEKIFNLAHSKQKLTETIKLQKEEIDLWTKKTTELRCFLNEVNEKILVEQKTNLEVLAATQGECDHYLDKIKTLKEKLKSANHFILMSNLFLIAIIVSLLLLILVNIPTP